MNRFSQVISPTLSLVTVGTYSEEGIASSCYHNNLAVLENTLSHMTDDGVAVVDMVAGTDAFASTLFAQFDVLFFVAEPTMRSLAVFDQYKKLAIKGSVLDRLFVIGNKIDDAEDEEYIQNVVGDRYVASISRSSQILNVDKGRARLDASKMNAADIVALQRIASIAKEHTTSAQSRLELLWKLHSTYVQQAFITERFGDLTNQIDPTFVYPSAQHE
jgi:CO dehydrogenase maturation factor